MISFLSTMAVSIRLMRVGSVSFQRRWTTLYSSVIARSALFSSFWKMSFSAVKAGSE